MVMKKRLVNKIKNIGEYIESIKTTLAELSKERVREGKKPKEAVMDIHQATMISLIDMSINLKMAPTILIQMVCALFEQRFADFTAEEMQTFATTLQGQINAELEQKKTTN